MDFKQYSFKTFSLIYPNWILSLPYSFVKVNPWYFSFFPQKSELHFGNLGLSLPYYNIFTVP